MTPGRDGFDAWCAPRVRSGRAAADTPRPLPRRGTAGTYRRGVSQAGVLLMAVAGLWIAYLVPHRLRYRQQLLECRNDDRFSGALRVVRVTGAAGAQTVRPVAVGTGRVHLHPPARGGGGSVDRPHALTDRVIADAVRRTAAEHAHRASHLSRRAAGARRRALLAATLLVLAVAGWGGVAVGGLLAVAAVTPTVALGAVLVLGRRAVVAAHRADVAWAAAAPERAARRALIGPTVVGRAVQPSDAQTEVFARVPAQTRTAAVSAAAEPTTSDVGGTSWVPVPVPRPSYTLKPSVRRAEPAPLVLDEPAAVAELAEESADESWETGVGSGSAVGSSAGSASGGFDLDAVLARRRAAGE